MDLYFIALLPGEELRERIRAVKERMRDEFGASHALKSPAHITLQKPFKMSGSGISAIRAALAELVLNEKPFPVTLDGYGSFPPRVIFISIADPAPARALHRRLTEMLAAKRCLPDDEIMHDLHPHITVATRDLSREAFREAWPQLKDEEFSGSFTVSSIFLLRHNGRYWETEREFPFGADE